MLKSKKLNIMTTTTRIGKIGRLSKDLRDELGQRIENGQPGTKIVYWLNHEPDVQDILKELFAGRPISEQNLSDWKQTGHLEWLRRQEARQAARQLTEQAEDLDEAVPDRNLSDRFATVLTSEMTRLALALLEPETDPEKRWKRLCEIHRELAHLRRDDHRAVRTAIQRERWHWEKLREAKAEGQREQQASKERSIDLLLAQRRKQDFAEGLFGGGESGRYNAELLHRLKFDLPLDDLEDGTWAKKTRPVPVKETVGRVPSRGVSAKKTRPVEAEETPESQARTASGPNSQRSAIVPLKETVGRVPSPGVSARKP